MFLDVPWRIASYRIVSRHVKLTAARNNPYPGWRGLYQFWSWSRRYYKSSNTPRLNSWAVPDNRATVVELLDAYKSKMVTCRTNKDIEQFLA